MTANYVLGIDLGTTNNVIAFAALDAPEARIQLLKIPQLVAANTVEVLESLPSFLYLAQPHEAVDGAFDLPWATDREFIVGEWARRQSAEAPLRTISAAKSWLAHSGVDRHRAILPWQSPEEVAKLSPVEVSRQYLAHVVAAWSEAFPDAPIEQQQVVLTVPASFDASARELTREAALAAGLPESLVLLEEPQAAVYAWIDTLGDTWRTQVEVGDTLLVCDVGGGTTDLTLIGVGQERGELILERIAVGHHLLVGGDNMDLALAHHAAQRFREQGVQLDAWQSVSLWHACRAAKEALLADGGEATHSISVLGRGSRLIGGTVSIDLQRQQAADLLVEGFFPVCPVDEAPQRQRASGFQEIGLPFEADTAITRHVASFLNTHGGAQCGDDTHNATDSGRPAYVLFNGGVFQADVFRTRLLEVLAGWYPEEAPPRMLAGNPDLDHAVARGAAHYGWAKTSGGVRIRGGTARGYYVGIETSGLAVPGAPRPLRALCVVPRGMEEGTELDVPSPEIGLVVGQTAQFRFFSSSVRADDQPGDVLASWDPDELTETAPLKAALSVEEPSDETYVPVRFQTRITELGMFELWCVSTQGAGRWKLEFSVRESSGV
jgi:hypothetical protein